MAQRLLKQAKRTSAREFAAFGLRGIGDFTMVKLPENHRRETIVKQ
jgi:hypothetical protein